MSFMVLHLSFPNLSISFIAKKLARVVIVELNGNRNCLMMKWNHQNVKHSENFTFILRHTLMVSNSSL